MAIAERVHGLTGRLVESLRTAGVTVVNDTFFDTVTIEVPGKAREYADSAEAAGLNLRRIDQDRLGVSLDELTDVETLTRVLGVFGAELVEDVIAGIPGDLARQTPYLTHPVFTAHRSETQMLRYLRTLADKDLALDRTMIPLGSCTMKLNSTTSMIPITWPEFSSIHPYAPEHQAAGYLEMIDELETWLSEITGYDAVSLQPNAGSQGEFAGLLAIRAYHRSRGEGDRDICLIPSSAHGTNAASAVMAGMTVKVVACDDNGNVDLDDLKAKLDEYSERGAFGADVSHLNLHKTFTIPHGGGGPGVGPIGVRSHLAPFLPGDPLADGSPVGPVSAAKYGSAGILPIPWAYIAMMGADGLTTATQVAVLEANHVTGISAEDIAKRLADHGFHAPTLSFPVAGTLMIEPTESEPLVELQRFCEAMISIRQEISRVESGEWPADDNPLVNAPHTAAMLLSDDWNHPYPPSVGAFPTEELEAKGYFPPVGRIDGAAGDRHLVCTCPPISEFVD